MRKSQNPPNRPAADATKRRIRGKTSQGMSPWLFPSDKILRDLLALEKKRRGIDDRQIIFIGIANIAQYWWCAEYSVLKSREDELSFFKSYLHDRWSYSTELGHFEKMPRKREDKLRIGDDIKSTDVEMLLDKRRPDVTTNGELLSPDNMAASTLLLRGQDKEEVIANLFIRDGSGLRLNPELEEGEKPLVIQFAIEQGLPLVDVDPLAKGTLCEQIYAETYPRLRWHWQWDKYVVVGVPDGVTDRLVYEFKSSSNAFLMRFQQPVATTQADLYGYFWQRPTKRVQLYNTSEKKMKTIEEPTNKERALETLAKFRDVDAGVVPQRPLAWKCEKCKFFKCRLH